MEFIQNFVGKLKKSWLFFAFAIVALILWNTNILFQNLSQEERSKMELWAIAQEEYIQNQDLNNLTFEILQRAEKNPMIQVNDQGKIIEIRNINWNQKKQDSSELYSILEKIKNENLPILIQFRDNTGTLVINQKLYYGDSTTLKKLQYYPLALLLIIILFGAVLYFVFKTTRIAEQNRLWVGMAKETAHQIGTPLTSMMGWVTLLKEEHPGSRSIFEIEKDIERLNLITDRFSKVGSIPELVSNDIVYSITSTVNYLQKRSSEQIEFKLNLPKEKISIPFNPQLISWTLENLIKNGIDAMKGKGVLNISLNEFASYIEILIQDNGPGMNKEILSKIFKPGFTTKKRGWGLGLSLSKRIVENFHSGKISVQKTALDQGTTFKLILNKTLQK